MESLRQKISPSKFGLGLACVFLLLNLSAFTSLAQEGSSVLPKNITVQHAGSIGFISVGAGYDLFKNRRGSIDLHFGFVPKSKGGPLGILTAKFGYRPFKIDLNNWITIHPIIPGAFISYHAGEEFEMSWSDDQYEKGYYWWSTAIRPHLSINNEIRLSEKIFRNNRIKGLTFFYELNSNELYLINFIQNSKALSAKDVIKVGYGVKLHF